MNFDNKFRNSDEYNILINQIDKLNPNLPLYLKEMVIMMHLSNPHMYKEEKKKNKGKPPVETVKKEALATIYNSIEIISPLIE